MLSIINSCCCLGMETHYVRVEVDVSRGLPAFNIVGLPGKYAGSSWYFPGSPHL